MCVEVNQQMSVCIAREKLARRFKALNRITTSAGGSPPASDTFCDLTASGAVPLTPVLLDGLMIGYQTTLQTL